MAASTPAPSPARRTSWGTLFAWIVCIGLSAAGFRNALAPEPELEAQARAVACAASAEVAALSSAATPPAARPPASSSAATPAARPPASSSAATPPAPSSASKPAAGTQAAPALACALQSTLWESGPLGRAFGFEDPRAGVRLRVQCRREHIALGDYQCARVP